MSPHFTTLPREIRDAILEMCLVVGTINPYPWRNWKCESTRKPDMSLLAVNKAINAEASEIFYGKNVWVINWCSNDADPGGWVHQATMDKIWHIRHDQIRHVRISLCLLEICYRYSKFCQRYRVVEACQWKLNICRELGFKSVTIDITGCTFDTPSSRSDLIKRCCLKPLLKWVRSDEETRLAEPSQVLVRRYPNIIVTSNHLDDILVVRQGWEEK